MCRTWPRRWGDVDTRVCSGVCGRCCGGPFQVWDIPSVVGSRPLQLVLHPFWSCLLRVTHRMVSWMPPSESLISNCRFDHSCKLCVSSCKSPVNFRPVSAACGPTEAALAAASPPKHRQLEQRIRTDRFQHGCIWNAVEAYHLHKNQGQFPKNYNFFQLCSL